MPHSAQSTSLLAAAREMVPHILACRDAIDRDRCLPPDLVARLKAAQLLQLWLPRSLGGPELHPADFIRVIETLAAADASVAWCATNAGVFSLLGGSMAEDAAREVFGDQRVVAGSINPAGTAVAAEGGYTGSGRWSYCSGIGHADWVLGSCMVQTGEAKPEARFLLFPCDAVEVIDTWQVSGMRGTGSHDMQAHSVFVPQARTVPAFNAPAVQPGTLYRVPRLSLFCVALAAVTLGIARAAIDDLVALAGQKTPVGSTVPLRDKPAAQTNIARAEALVRAARALLLETVSAQFDEVAAGETAVMATRASVRLATTYCAEACTQAVDLVHTTAGGSAIFESGRIARCFRDIHAATQHIGLSVNTYEVAGRVLLGLDPGTPRF